ncbi:hydroxymethylbilane synthase [Candidatus Phycosocius spiralis]|nr:hydroxymethylbilane synthase [Candidatus Phycosocius spiralis]
MRIGARGSPLSLAQTGQLRALLAASMGIEDDQIEARLPIIAITTTGDRIQDRPLSEAGGKGLFTKELDDALLDGRIDCAIHSLKDVPTQVPEGIVLLPGPKREDRRDALVTLTGSRLEDLKQGAVIGSASLRRAAQLLHARPDLTIVSLRGNVGTRLDKLKSGHCDATLLAAAGLNRLGYDQTPHILLDPHIMPPAIGQGALAITARTGDITTAAAFAQIADPITAVEVAAERAFLTALDGSCRTAIGALAQVDHHGQLSFVGEALSEDGKCRWRSDGSIKQANVEQAEDLGRELGLKVKAMAGYGFAGAMS